MRRYLTTFIVGLALLAVFGALHQHYTRPSQPAEQPKKIYVAMGDSVAAGVGLSGDSDSSACDRTNQSYPSQLASALQYKLINLACSGATLPAGILGKQDVNDLLVAAQLQQLFAQPKPSLITLTIGANDAQWTSIIGKCYTGECGDAADQAAVAANLAIVSSNLQSALAKIKAAYSSAPPAVIITGYHQVFPASNTATCGDLTGIDAGELAWGRQLQTSINDTLRQAVASAGFGTFVPVNFSGHELCTTNSWVQGLADQEPYHPTAAGQAEFARQVVSAVKAPKS